MKPPSLMLQSALNRLEYWQAALVSAKNAGDTQKIAEAARFVEEYGLLIKQMAA